MLAEWMVIGCTVPVHALDPKKTVSQYIYDHWGANNGFRTFYVLQTIDYKNQLTPQVKASRKFRGVYEGPLWFSSNYCN
jgi:hypothetical protein